MEKKWYTVRKGVINIYFIYLPIPILCFIPQD